MRNLARLREIFHKVRHWIGKGCQHIAALSLSRQTIFFVGCHVQVQPLKLDGNPHPHAGKTGTVVRLIGDYPPIRAMVRLDAGIEPQGFICVSTPCLLLLLSPEQSTS